MTEPTAFFHDRAAEIIAAYGADTARWPDAERATAMTVIAADPALSAMLDDARQLDRDVIAWARHPVRGGNAPAAAAIAMQRPRHFMRWAASGSIAASLAAAIILLTPSQITPSTQSGNGGTVVASVSDDVAFAHVFTPTPDEEHIL